VLSDEFKASLKHEYKSFFASEQVYKDLGVPWKRGIIFLGVSVAVINMTGRASLH
jgi:hypothetical protein